MGETVIEDSDEETLLGIMLDTKFNFKLICSHLQTSKPEAARTIKSFDGEFLVLSHFSYCPLIWIVHDRKIDNKIIKIQERALRACSYEMSYPRKPGYFG